MYQHILVPLDGSALAESVLPHVQRLARLSAETRLTLLRAVPYEYLPMAEFELVVRSPTNPPEVTNRLVDNARTYLESIVARLHSDGYRVDTHVSRRDAAEAIVEYAAQHGVDLIVIATHGRSGLSRWMFGSVTQKVLQATAVPTLVIRPGKTPPSRQE